LLVGADDLMCPPLVTDLMGRNVGDEINGFIAAGLMVVLVEADALGERHGIGEGLREGIVGGELENARLPELERGELLTEQRKRHAHGIEHALHVVLVPRVVVDRQIDWSTVGAGPAVLLERIACRLQ
jgi:hypothetical protein